MKTLFGFIGMALLLYAFYMNQKGKWDDTDMKYDAVNLLGSIILLLYALILDSWPFFLLNAVWAGVSFKDILHDLYEDQKPHLQRRHKRVVKKRPAKK